MSSSAIVKLRTVAAANVSLQGFLQTGAGVFRWYDTQHVQGSPLPDVTARIVSSPADYLQQGRVKLSGVRVQIDVRDTDPDHARTVADAVIAMLDGFDGTGASGVALASPKPGPTFVLNQRDGLDFNTTPPIPVQSIDVRLYNLSN